MKSSKTILIFSLVLISVIGLATLQDNIFEEYQFVDVNEFSSESKTITIEMADGVGFEEYG